MHPEIDSLIIYEDAHIIVCHKPAGIPTQTARIGTPDMVSMLKTHLAPHQRASLISPSSTAWTSRWKGCSYSRRRLLPPGN